MNKLFGCIMTGALLLGQTSAADAQITIQPRRGGAPSITFGQPAYNPQYAQPNYAQPGYGQPYQPNYTQPYQPSYAQPRYTQPYQQGTYSSGYSNYYAPGTTNNQVYRYPNTQTPGYMVPYGQQPGVYNNGYYPNTQPYAPQGNGLIINGRTFTLPR